MEVDYIQNILQVVNNKKLEFVDNKHPFLKTFYESVNKLRDCLVKIEERDYPNGNLPQLSVTSPLKLSLKSQLDFLGREIPVIYNMFCVSLASAYYFLPHTSDTVNEYSYKMPDLLFWINVDSGFRFASSGWDRLSLLLNIAFNLRIDKYNLSSVLQAIPNRIRNVTQDNNFKSLKKFRDGRFSELEYKLGGGARHETTHVISRDTRFFFEFLEHELGSDEFKVRRDNELKLLEEHYNVLIEGIKHSLNLINTRFDEKVYETQD